MKAFKFRRHMNVSVFNLIFVFMSVLPCVVSAQGENTVRYRVVEDPGHHLFSRQNLRLAFTLAFDPEQFNELWPRYGYEYNAVSDNITDLCRRENLNSSMSIGRSAIARLAPSNQNSEVLMALPIENNTNPQAVHDFLSVRSFPDNQSALGYGYRDSTEDLSPVTIESICGIILDDSPDTLNGAVIVTQHPLPIPERHSYRLLPDGSFADSSWVGSMEQSGGTAQ